MCGEFNQLVEHLIKRLFDTASSFTEAIAQSWTSEQRKYANRFVTRMNAEYANAIEAVSENLDFKAKLKGAAGDIASLLAENAKNLILDFSDTIRTFGLNLVVRFVKFCWKYFQKHKAQREAIALSQDYLDLDCQYWNEQVYKLVESFTSMHGDTLQPGIKLSKLQELVSHDADVCIKFIRQQSKPREGRSTVKRPFAIEDMWRAGLTSCFLCILTTHSSTACSIPEGSCLLLVVPACCSFCLNFLFGTENMAAQCSQSCL